MSRAKEYEPGFVALVYPGSISVLGHTFTVSHKSTTNCKHLPINQQTKSSKPLTFNL